MEDVEGLISISSFAAIQIVIIWKPEKSIFHIHANNESVVHPMYTWTVCWYFLTNGNTYIFSGEVI